MRCQIKICIFIIGIINISCCANRNLSTNEGITSKNALNNESISESEPVPIELEDDYNKCFSIENGYDDFVYTDTLVVKTNKGNFFKKVSISDSTFVWSSGRGEIEKYIGTFSCTTVVESWIDWETEEFIGLIKPCGTYCWTNTIIPVNTDKPIIYLSYSAIDFETMNTVSIVDDYFLISNLKTRKEIKTPIDYLACLNAFPLLSTDEIKLEDDTVSFVVRCKNDSTVMHKQNIDLMHMLD